MELREFAKRMMQEEQFEFLDTRLEEMEDELAQKAIQLEQANDNGTREAIADQIERLEAIALEVEDCVNNFVFNKLTFGCLVSSSVVDLYQSTVLSPFAEY